MVTKVIAREPRTRMFCSLARYIAQYGELSPALVLRDTVTSQSRGLGFINFRDEHSVKRVLAQSNNSVADGRKVEAKVAIPKN